MQTPHDSVSAFIESLSHTHFAKGDSAVMLADDLPSPSAIGKSSFAYKESSGSIVYIYGGYVCWSGRLPLFIAEDSSVAVTGGSAVSPAFVALKIPEDEEMWAGWTAADALVCSATYPADAGGFFYRVLFSAYLDGPDAVFVQDHRHDVLLRSPL